MVGMKVYDENNGFGTITYQVTSAGGYGYVIVNWDRDLSSYTQIPTDNIIRDENGGLEIRW